MLQDLSRSRLQPKTDSTELLPESDHSTDGRKTGQLHQILTTKYQTDKSSLREIPTGRTLKLKNQIT